MEIGNKWDEKKNNINAKSGCYIFIRDEFYKLKVQNMNLNLVWIIQIGNREKKIKKKEKNTRNPHLGHFPWSAHLHHPIPRGPRFSTG
jgi:hypothetical protein